jgi:mycofactocin precursor
LALDALSIRAKATGPEPRPEEDVLDTTELTDQIEDGTQDESAEGELAESLIEEVSIDGMCGVY